MRKGWWRRKPSSSQLEVGPRPRRRSWSTALAALAALVVILAFAESKFIAAGNWIHRKLDPPPAKLVQVDRVVLGNPDAAYNSLGTFGEQTPASAPQLDIAFRNDRDDAVALRAAQVTIEDSARFPVCIPPQGGGPVPESRYPLTLPLPPTPHGLVARYALFDEVPAGAEDHPVLRFGVEGGRQGGYESYLYALHVELAVDGQARVDLGRFLLAVPGPLERWSGSYFPEDDYVLRTELHAFGQPTVLLGTWCFRRNLAVVHRLTGWPGRRSVDVRALGAIGLAPGWNRYADPRPPKQAARSLIGLSGEGPQLAAFAAAQAGDPAFAAKYRRLAAARLLHRAEKELHEQGFVESAGRDARDALDLADSEAARTLLLRAETRLRADEAKAGE